MGKDTLVFPSAAALWARPSVVARPLESQFDEGESGEIEPEEQTFAEEQIAEEEFGEDDWELDENI